MAFERYAVDQPKGVNFTIEPAQLPNTVWDNASEVSFRHGKTLKVCGYEEGLGSTNGIMPYVMSPMKVSSGEGYRWAYSSEVDGAGKLYMVQSRDSHTDVTPTTAIDLDSSYPWSADTINSLAYFTKEKPYWWKESGSRFELPKLFPTHLKTQLVRTYKNHMMCLGITVDSFNPDSVDNTWMPNLTDEERTEYAKKFGYWSAGKHSDAVWWSDEIVGDNLDVNWADGDPTSESGWNFLGGSGGHIVDGRALRDSFIIYRERSVWQVNYVGGINVFTWRELFSDAGALALNCVTDIDGWHFVVGVSDIYMHNGVQKKSVADGVVKDIIYKYINPDHVDKVFTVAKYDDREVWVCVPSPTGSIDGLCDTAFVYNWEEQTWSTRKLPNTKCSMYTSLSIEEESSAWNGGKWDMPWTQATALWVNAGFRYNPADWGICFSGYTTEDSAGHIYTTNDSTLKNGVGFVAYVEKKWMDMGDRNQFKAINKVFPLVRKGIVNVYVAGTNAIMEAPNWRFAGVYDPTKSPHVACRANGRFLHVRFEIPESSSAELYGYWIEYSRNGTR